MTSVRSSTDEVLVGDAPTRGEDAGLSDRMLGIAGIVGALMGAVLVVLITVSSLTSNPPVLTFPTPLQNLMRQIAPQGWQFFTKDPQSANILPFRSQGSRFVSIQLQSALHPSTLFGLDRVNREQGVEMGVVTAEIPARAWLPCKVAPGQCLEAIPVELRIADNMPHPTLCGDVGFANQAPLPWAWARLDPVPILPSTVVRVRVTCTS